MLSTLTVGRAAQDSEEFRHWLVGDIASWTSSRSNPVDLPSVGLRNTQQVEIKWGIHPAGEERPGGWVGPHGKCAISILLRGRFVIHFRDATRPEDRRDVTLSEPGDYVLWSEGHEHRWQAIEDSLVLTVRWPLREAGAASASP